jgi:hypothetical protein
MTDVRMALTDLLLKSGDSDFLRSVAGAVLHIQTKADVNGVIGAGCHERSAEQVAELLSGSHPRQAPVSLQLRVPKVQQEIYFRPFLEPRKSVSARVHCAADRGRVTLPVARRHLSAPARCRTRGLRAAIIAGGQLRRKARDSRPQHKAFGGRAVLWSGFLKSLVRRALKSMNLIISDAYEGRARAEGLRPTHLTQTDSGKYRCGSRKR